MDRLDVTRPQLSVIVLAWNQLPLTQRCVSSLRANTDVSYELVIVDNGSEPEAAEFAGSAGDIAILNHTNLGFAAGMNTGLEASTGDYVAFVNNDTAMPEGWASPLLATFADHPDAAIVLPAVTAAGNPFSVRTEPGSRRIVAPPFRTLPSGVVYVMERTTATSLGGWDLRYGRASAEDLDLLWKVWVNGFEVVLDERVLVEHVGGASVDTIDDKTALYRRNRLAFADRWSSDDPEAPFVGHIGQEDHARRLETAAVAATWMRRAFTAEDTAGDARRELRRLGGSPERGPRAEDPTTVANTPTADRRRRDSPRRT